MKPGMLVMAGFVALVLGLLAGGILGHMAAPPTVTTSGTDHLYLTVAFNPYTGLDEYLPANFTVPANGLVIVTITNFDNGTNAVPNAVTKVSGTLGGTETITNATASGVVVSSVPLDQVAHTFTVQAGSYNVNVPIPAAQGQTPTVVVFTVVFSTAGEYTWHCLAPCDRAAMTTPGFMTGTITVVSA